MASLSPHFAAAQAAAPQRRSPRLSEVTLVAAGCSELPEGAPLWPVRVVLPSATGLDSLENTYICGQLDDVCVLLGKVSRGKAPLAVLVVGAQDAERAKLPAGVEVIELPALAQGLHGMATWESVIRTVCSRHLETIQEMALEHARRTPDKVALIYEDKGECRKWTFRQLLSMACSFKSVVGRLYGITPEGGPLAVQSLCTDRLVIVYLGLLCSRWLWQQVDAHPKSRSYRLEVFPSQALLCERDAIPTTEIKMIFIEDICLQLEATRPVEELSVEGELGDPCFLDYTSGSTGTPKAVMTWNWRMAHWVRWRQFHYPLTAGDDCEARNLFFVWYWHISLCQGGTTVVYPNFMNMDVSAMMKYVKKHSVTRCDCLTPGLILAILEVEDTLPPALTWMSSSGEALPTVTCSDWLRRFPSCKLVNIMSMTEASADIVMCEITHETASLDMLYAPISDGKVVWNNEISIVEEEMVVKGWNVGEGYMPPTVSNKFQIDSDLCWNKYFCGDRCAWSGNYLSILGRVDTMVKVRGYNVDLSGLEAVLAGFDIVKDVACVYYQDTVCGLVVTDDIEAVKRLAVEQLPQHKLLVWYTATNLPYGATGKRDRQTCKKWLQEENAAFTRASVDKGPAGTNGHSLVGGPPATDAERHVAAAWKELLGRDVGRQETFLEAGGHSIMAMRLAKKLNLQPADIFAFPTVAQMAARLSGVDTVASPSAALPKGADGDLRSVAAIVGMAGRFPGATSTSALWSALESGADLISDVKGASPEHVPRKGIAGDLGFDCGFWGVPADLAKTMDTTQRALLEAAYEALEDAGFDPFHVPGRVGVVMCGGSLPHYASDSLGIDLDESRSERPDEYFALEIGIDKDFVATNIAYRLNLHGPADVVQAACSSSLIAVVRAVEWLRLGVCDYVICGGGSFTPDVAFRKVDGMIWSPEGVCRPFADDANGTVHSDGCGLVVLTRLDAAMERGERIYATIPGVNTNNDGARKAGFSAPSFEGQVECIRAAHADAGVTGNDIDYIEAHGTGTKLGDPLELHALTEALATKREILLGSVKGNIGHMNTAAGVPGLIKAALMLYHQRMVPSRHADNPNTLIDWEKTPLRLAASAHDWNGKVAAVSSFGIGGTNAHVVLRRAPDQSTVEPSRSVHLFTASAKNPEALKDACSNLSGAASDTACAEATLLARPRFEHRSFALSPKDLQHASHVSSRRKVVLLFAGQGGAYAGMGSALATEGLVNCNCTGLAPVDIVRASLAVAESLEKQGLQVDAVFGHSLGEWAAAAFAGVIPAEVALKLAELRGQLMSTMEPGTMVSARASASQVKDLAQNGVEMACVNGAETVVLAGPVDKMTCCAAELDKRGITYKQLQTSGAFHTAAVDKILPAYKEALQKVEFSQARCPILSNVTGEWHGNDTTNAQYWADHLRKPVLFFDNLKCLAQRFPTAVVVEVGPSVLAGVVARETGKLGVDWQVVPTMRERDEIASYVRCLGTLWAHSDFQPSLPTGALKRQSLPTYPFQRVQLATKKAKATKTSRQPVSSIAKAAAKKDDPVADFLYKTHHERVQVSCFHPKEAAVVLDGEVLPGGLPDRVVHASADRAAVAARSSGYLLFIGTSTASPTIDDVSQETLIKDVVALLQSLAKARLQAEIYFCLKPTVRYAALWGLLRSAARELPELRIRRLLLEDDAPLIFPVMAGEYILKADGAYTPRLRPAPLPRVAETPPAYSRALVTGGLRGLGVRVAEWLLSSKRASALVLVGRNAPEGDNAALVQRLQSEASVEVCIGDVSQWKDVEKLPECDLVVHVAGGVKDGFLLRASEADMQIVLRPKIRGAVHIKKQFPKSRCIGFSSSSGLFGTAGQATYSAANIFLDAIMPTVQWGGWGETGMAVDLGIAPGEGERFFSLKDGLDCLGRVLDAPEKTGWLCQPALALDVDWHLYRQNADAFSLEDPLLADIDAQPRQPSLLGESITRLSNVAHTWELVLGPDGSRFRGSCQAWDVCQQHVINYTPIFPGTAFVALALQVAKELEISNPAVKDVAWLRPLQLVTARRLTTAFVQNSDGSQGGSIRFSSQEIRADGEDEEAAAVLHCTCTLVPTPKLRPDSISVKAETMDTVTDLYDRFASVGFNYGPAFRATSVALAKDRSTASCEFVKDLSTSFQVHPAALDTSMHLVALLHSSGLSGVPHKVRRISMIKAATSVSAKAVLNDEEISIQLVDRTGDVTCIVEGLELVPMSAPATLQLRRRVWQALAPVPRGVWLLHDQQTRSHLDILPDVCTAGDGKSPAAVVFVVEANTLEDVRRCADTARDLSARGPCWAVALSARFAEAAAAAAVEVGAQAVIGTLNDVRAAAGGLGVQASLVHARDGKLFVEALEEAPKPAPTPAGPSDAFAVTTDPSQGAKGAKCQWSRRRAPAANEVELKTSVWALNFRDVLVAVGAIPSTVAGQSLGIGGECFGEVVRVGADVKGLAVGDRVIGTPPDGMGSFTTFDARWVGAAPSTMTPAEAVSGTMVYATAWLGLHWMARVSRGERVLIHSAAGGVGLSAVHLCLRAGCVVYVTASTDEKRKLLLSLGAAAAFDSRDVAAFERGVLTETNGEGIDVVLNSLSGEAIPASLRLLRPFGRFIEIGKRDQYEDTRIGLGPFLNGLTMAMAHLDVLMLKQPDRCRQLLEEVWVAMPDLPKLPVSTFKINELSNALEYFSKGIHIGKVLVTIEDDALVHPAAPSSVSGPLGDAVTQALRVKMGADDKLGGVICIPRLEDLTEVKIEAHAVLTSSRAVAEYIGALDNAPTLCVELPRWEPIAGLGDWLGLNGRFVATEEEKGGDLQQWLMEVVEDMAGSISMDQTFESVGLDSLALISLARRLSSKVGKTVSVVDLYDHPTPQQLISALGGGPQAQIQRAKVVALHGFRTNRDIMNLTCAALVSAVGFVEWVFINSPRRASGPGDPNVPPDMEVFEWYGEKGGSYELGWMPVHSDGLEQTLPTVTALAPVGVVGFSQGGAIATLVDCAWVALFSSMMPPTPRKRETPSFHSYDPVEEYVSQCLEVTELFSDKEVHTHGERHNIPQNKDIVKLFADFVARQQGRES